MPRQRNWPPPALEDMTAAMIAQFARDYSRAAERERSLPKEQRLITNMGPTYAAAGWRLYHDAHLGRRRNSRPPGEPRPAARAIERAQQ